MERMELMSEGAAGEYIGGVSSRTLQAWRKARRGPTYRKVGHRVFYARADLDTFLRDASRATEPAPKEAA